MARPSFYGEHNCDICWRYVYEHDEDCGNGEDENGRWEPCRHFPALCCPGCRCGSFEEAHPELCVSVSA